ncbi:hypothetical protein R9C00_25570 [Flammeovirgaceae bacterium SG7u.111]|nr:hypothetical protein [Flammeovirgaceae bacterium SG7u.132]WPO35067.1 hypothetical protein R9C00_25570 [Flammeovirgaceae bacterium SG7u.111]
MKKFSSQLFWRLFPLLLLAFYPFADKLEAFLPSLQIYTSLDRYILLVLFVGVGFLMFDYLFRYTNWFAHNRFMVFGTLLLGFSFLIRVSMFGFESDDYLGNGFSDWYDFIKTNGGFSALAENSFTTYNVPYLYVLAFLSYLPISKLIGIKLFSVLFDYLGAWAIFKILRLKTSFKISFVGTVVFLFFPTVLLNGSFWGQSDVVYTSLLLWAFYGMLLFVKSGKEVKLAGLPVLLFIMICIGLSVSYKLQAIFFALPLLLLYFKKTFNLLHVVLPLVVWFLLLIPCWLLGRSLLDLLLIYPRQFMQDAALTLDAPSVYQLFPNAPFESLHSAGLLFVLFILAGFAWLFTSEKFKLTDETLMWVTMLSFLLFPYFLPKMHDRYFFPADVFSIVFAFWYPKKWFVPVVVGSISFFSYIPFLFDTSVVPYSFLAIGMGLILLFLLKDFAKKFMFEVQEK